MAIVYTKKYVNRNGKRYGPYPQGEDYYLYEASKVKGKVRMRYLGRGLKPTNGNEKIPELKQQMETEEVSQIHDYEWWSNIGRDLDFMELTTTLYRDRKFKEINDAFEARSSMATFSDNLRRRANGDTLIETAIISYSNTLLTEMTQKRIEERNEELAEIRRMIMDRRSMEYLKLHTKDPNSKGERDIDKTKSTSEELDIFPKNNISILDTFHQTELEKMFPKRSGSVLIKKKP